MRAFYHLVVNTTFASIINFAVWFAITFYVYLETKSVFATGMIAGIYLVLTALTGIWFGSLVDHHKKKNVMILSSVGSLILYAVSFAIYLLVPESSFQDITSVYLWAFVLPLMVGVILGNLRGIALPTAVTFLVPEDKHDKANGLVGASNGLVFSITAVLSGFLVARSGMFDVLVLSLVVTAATIIHLFFLHVPEKHAPHHESQPRKIDLRGTIKAIGIVPGLGALILFNCINNLLGGVFMALMDAYGLSLVSVEWWGVVLAITSGGFIVGGLIISKFGLGRNPVRSLMLANVAMWVISILFPVYASIILLGIGFFLYLTIMPYIEASEQTVVQKVVPQDRQGRVFGFSQSVEQMASPLTAFLIGPLTQFFFIPFMTDGFGAEAIGSWFGTGQARGIALVFVLTGIIGLILTLLAFNSKYYHQLSKYYLKGK